MIKDKKQIAFTGSEEYRVWIGDQARKEKLKVQGFLEKVVAAYVERSGVDGAQVFAAGPRDAGLTANTDQERRLIGALLRLLREESPDEKREPFVAAIEKMLEPWLRPPRKAHAKKNTAKVRA